jgi:ubiquinone/menaquinone biosynthesis C-methylase UbiE
LDIGFGNGYLLKKIIRQNVPVKIYGIEISNDMLNKVKLKNIHNIENGILELYLANINETSFENNLFDKMYTINTMYFWNELDKCLFEIKMVLKPKVIFMNVMYTKKYLGKMLFTKYGFNKYSVEEIEKITKDNGMEIMETIGIKKNILYNIQEQKVKNV